MNRMKSHDYESAEELFGDTEAELDDIYLDLLSSYNSAFPTDDPAPGLMKAISTIEGEILSGKTVIEDYEKIFPALRRLRPNSPQEVIDLFAENDLKYLLNGTPYTLNTDDAIREHYLGKQNGMC